MTEGYFSRAASKVDTAIEKAKAAPKRWASRTKATAGTAKQKVKSSIERGAGKATLFFAKPLAVIGIGYLIWIKTGPQRERIIEPIGEEG